MSLLLQVFKQSLNLQLPLSFKVLVQRSTCCHSALCRIVTESIVDILHLPLNLGLNSLLPLTIPSSSPFVVGGTPMKDIVHTMICMYRSLFVNKKPCKDRKKNTIRIVTFEYISSLNHELHKQHLQNRNGN